MACAPAAAWGDLGHRVTALIAYRHLLPTARAQLDALLASDGDPLTAPDFASRATWADKYRNGHRETAAWHFVDIEIDHPELQSACNGFPVLTVDQIASQGPAQDCVVNKIEEFSAELSGLRTPPAERLLALKFLIHFVGDLHQPLHAADHQDRGGNCKRPRSDWRRCSTPPWGLNRRWNGSPGISYSYLPSCASGNRPDIAAPAESLCVRAIVWHPRDPWTCRHSSN